MYMIWSGGTEGATYLGHESRMRGDLAFNFSCIVQMESYADDALMQNHRSRTEKKYT